MNFSFDRQIKESLERGRIFYPRNVLMVRHKGGRSVRLVTPNGRSGIWITAREARILMDRKVVRIFKKKPFILQIIGISTINSALIPENCRRFIEDYRTQHLAARTGKTQKTILSGNEYSERELGANG